MIPIAWAASAFAAAVITWQAALPAPRIEERPRPAARATDDDTRHEVALLARVEREVTEPLREKARDRWRFSRVHRPTPPLRTERDEARSDRSHVAFVVKCKPSPLATEHTSWHVRVARADGAIELAAPSHDGAALVWRPAAEVTEAAARVHRP
jgi:hypothetical protein